jgi:hypothetical protein
MITVPTQREMLDLTLDAVARVERGAAEFFATLPTEAERVAQICETVAQIERGRTAWLEGFIARGTVPE